MRSGIVSCSLLLVLGMLMVQQPGAAQRIYSESRDKEAQEAKMRAEDVTSGTAFDSQVRNLGRLQKQDFATYFRVARTRMRAEISAYDTWGAVKSLVNKRLQNTQHLDEIYDEGKLAQARRDAEAKIQEARDKLRDLKAKIKTFEDARLNRAAEALDDLQAFRNAVGKLEELTKLNKSTQIMDQRMDLSGFKEVGSVAEQFLTLYKTYEDALNGIQDRTKAVVELRVPLAQVAIESAQADAEHLGRIGAILLRRKNEEAQVSLLKHGFDDLYGFATKYLKDYSLTEESGIEDLSQNILHDEKLKPGEKRSRLINAAEVLYYAGAIAAHGGTPGRLAELRLAHEEHLYSIQKSALMARTYEATIRTGVQRLALYHQGGLKPEKIAQLLHDLATIAIPPAIITK